jgi:hypothetical protein
LFAPLAAAARNAAARISAAVPDQDLHLHPDLCWTERLSCANAARAIVASAKGENLKRIRVLLAGMPTLMLDILHHVVAAEPDMEIVGSVDVDGLSRAIQPTLPDVVVVGHDAQSERDLYLSLLLRRPQLKVLAIDDDGKNGWLYELRPRRIRLGKISARSLTKAIRRPTLPMSRTSRS